MRKICFILSLAGHALLILFALHADFPIVIIPAPTRVIAVEIAAPSPFFAPGQAAKSVGPVQAQWAAPSGAGGKNIATATAGRSRAAAGSGTPALPFTVPATFSLKEAPKNVFTLAPANRGPGLPLRPVGPGVSSSLERYSAAAYTPGAMVGGAAVPGGVVLIPFDIREKAVATWTEAVLARIERNWIIPVSARLAFSGQVQVTLTIEKNGLQQALVMDDSSLPQALAQSALQAVKASLPLPPLPENVAGRTFAFTFVFIYNG